MTRIEGYRGRADAIREIAEKAHTPEERDRLLDLAQLWDDLASSRFQMLKMHERIRGGSENGYGERGETAPHQ